ncbi:hypothetical protein P3L10_003683 [Capsicum annuum]
MVFVCLLALVGGVCGDGCWCKTCLPKEKKVKVDQRQTTKKKRLQYGGIRRSFLNNLNQQKSKVEERYEKNIEGGGQGSVDGDKENKSDKEEELESQKEKEDDHQHDDNGSLTGRELISTPQHNPVKTFSIDRFEVAMPINDPEGKQLTGQIVLKCQMGKIFEHFMKIMKNENIGGIFKKSYFERFLELPKDSSARIRFPMTMKMDEIWINYCGMLVCFGLQMFVIVTGLRCYHPEGPPPRKRSKARKCKGKIDGLFDIARRGYKASDLLIDLKDKTIPEQYREQLCLVWFVHSVIFVRDVNKVLQDVLLARAEDFDKFNNYPWGYDSFYLTVQYLLTKLSSGMTTLYVFLGLSWLGHLKPFLPSESS